MNQISVQFIKERCKPSSTHVAIYGVGGILSGIVGYLVGGILGSIVGFIALFGVLIFLDQKFIARRFNVSLKVMFTCLGMDNLPASLERLVNRTLIAYVESRQTIHHIWQAYRLPLSKNFTKVLDGLCDDFLILIAMTSRKRELLNEFATPFGQITNIFEELKSLCHDLKEAQDRGMQADDIEKRLSDKITELSRLINKSKASTMR